MLQTCGTVNLLKFFILEIISIFVRFTTTILCIIIVFISKMLVRITNEDYLLQTATEGVFSGSVLFVLASIPGPEVIHVKRFHAQLNRA